MDIEHGTSKGYSQHYKHKQLPTCAECKQAFNEYRKALRRAQGVGPAKPEAPCGTRSAYNRHLRRGEICQRCRDAQNAYITEFNKTSKTYRSRVQIYNTNRRNNLCRDMTKEDKQISVDYMLAISNDPCAYCGKVKDKMHIDHVVPLTRGGTNHWFNLVRACQTCNISKSNKSLEEWNG